MSNESLIFNEQDPGSLHKLYDAIGKASASFPDLPRTATGQVGKDRKFQYAPYHKVVRCIKPALAENGVTFLQPLHSEEEGKVSITLVVAGHGAVIASTLKVNQDSDPKVFGANATYYKRYQLTNFFGLEGDPDADDFESPLVESSTQTSKFVPSQPKRAETSKAESVEPKHVSEVGNTETPKNGSEAQKASAPNKEAPKDSRSIGEKLTDAMKQLVWKMEDFDKFCKEHPQDFPDFVSAAKLPPAGKIKLYELLVLHKGVAPF